MDVQKIGGGELPLGEAWQVVIVYRGRHCPKCKAYLKKLNGMIDDFTIAGLTLAVVSADTREEAQADVTEHGWRFPVGYGLSTSQMRHLGLYISHPRSPQETDRPFAEPGLFVVNGDRKAQIIDISNAPFARPDLQILLDGINFVRKNGYPVRGTAD